MCLSEGFVWGQCGFVGDSQVRLVESLCGVSVGLSEVSVWAVWVCARVPVQSRCESVLPVISVFKVLSDFG